MQIPFRNRADAGRRLGAALREYAGRHDVIVIAVPRGGVEVGCQVAAALELPLDVLNVRKLVCPGRRELTLGAIAPGGIRILNEQAIQQAGISGAQLDKIESVERRELDRREWALS